MITKLYTQTRMWKLESDTCENMLLIFMLNDSDSVKRTKAALHKHEFKLFDSQAFRCHFHLLGNGDKHRSNCTKRSSLGHTLSESIRYFFPDHTPMDTNSQSSTMSILGSPFLSVYYPWRMYHGPHIVVKDISHRCNPTLAAFQSWEMCNPGWN